MKKQAGIIVHTLFWAMGYVVLLGIFSTSSEWQSIDFIYTAIFIVSLMIPVGINEIILRTLLGTSKYSLWIILTLANILVFAYFNYILFDRLIDFILPGYYFISYYSYFDLLKFFVTFVGLATLIGFSIDWFELQEERRKVALLEKEKLGAEFKALVNQVNPHFLFNGLNVVYTLSLKDSRESSSAIMKLSDILKYVIYQSQESRVTIGSEAKIIRDYIDFHRYRVHPSTRIEFIEDTHDALIAPMLFLPLVENAFKHGVHNETENAFVQISLQEQNGIINFTVVNNKSSSEGKSGIGLTNLRQRLQLLYPQQHSVVITESEKEFSVTMQIKS
jgi:sensor histidine kinase YesM